MSATFEIASPLKFSFFSPSSYAGVARERRRQKVLRYAVFREQAKPGRRSEFERRSVRSSANGRARARRSASERSRAMMLVRNRGGLTYRGETGLALRSRCHRWCR